MLSETSSSPASTWSGLISREKTETNSPLGLEYHGVFLTVVPDRSGFAEIDIRNKCFMYTYLCSSLHYETTGHLLEVFPEES